MGDTLQIFGREFTNVAGFKATDDGGNVLTYTRGGGTSWDTLFNQNVTVVSDSPNYFIVNDYTEPIQENETYRITWGDGGTEYICQTVADQSSTTYDGYFIGNGTFLGSSYTDTGEPFLIYRDRTDRLVCGTTQTAGTLHLKIERQNSSGGGITPTGTINITTNGTHDVTNYASANVNVSSSASSLQTKTNINPTTSSQTITADSGYDGLSSVQINAMPGGSASTPATTVTANPSISVNSSGLITATTSASQSVTPTVSAGYVSAGTAGTITVSGSNTSQLTTQAAKTVTPTESEQTAVASGVYTTGIVKVGAISSTYVGSGIDQRDETDLTASGATVTVPAGFYAEQETKSVATATHADPTVSINSSTGLVTASHTQTAGYVSAGTTTDTLQLTTQAAATITPSTSSQTAVAAGRYTTGAVTVAAMPSGSAGTPSASKGTVSNHSISVTPSVTNTTGYIEGGTKYGSAVTVSASELVSGSQTITANGNVDVTNLASVTVALTFSTVTTSTSNPSGGSNGDIWIKTS